MNQSGILPTEYKCLVAPKEIGDKIGNIFIPNESKDREQFAQMEGTLVACSPLAFTYDNWNNASPPKPGDRVLFAKFAGAKIVGKDGKEYRLVNDKDIAAVLA